MKSRNAGKAALHHSMNQEVPAPPEAQASYKEAVPEVAEADIKRDTRDLVVATTKSD